MTMPNFLVIGTAKCGTTSVCDLLGRHPQVFISHPREPGFFGRRDPEKTLAWYQALFEGATGVAAVGEGSTVYTHPRNIQHTAEDIANQIPQCRLIFMVRDPIKRLESDWRMRKHEGWAEGSINQAVVRQDSLIGHGMYWKNLSVYLRSFSPEQILVVFLEDFARDAQFELERLFAHIRVDPLGLAPHANKPQNQSAGFRRDGLIARMIRRSSQLERLKSIFPAGVIQAGKLMITRKEDLSVQWDPKVRDSVIERFREDSRELLRYCGKPPDFWSSR